MSVHPTLTDVLVRLEEGKPLRIAFFGDSITAVHYHSGSRIAYPDLVGRALRTLYPSCDLQIINAGISGDRTARALGRMERDVLSHRPHLVSVMFGMNDVKHVDADVFAEQLTTMVQRARDAGAAVMLCTQNNMRDIGCSLRNLERLAQFSQAVRDVAARENLPVADTHFHWEKLRQEDPDTWALWLLNAFHPALHGHRLFARTIVEVICGQAAPEAALTNTQPALAHTLERVARNAPLRVTLLGVAVEVAVAALASAMPQAQVVLDVRDVAGLDLTQLVAEGHAALQDPGDLVFLCPPDEPGADAFTYAVSAEWLKVRLLPYGIDPPHRDLVFVTPSVVQPDAPPAWRARESILAHIADGADCACVRRRADDNRDATKLLAESLLQAIKA